MKYIAILIVSVIFYLVYANTQKVETTPVYIAARPGELTQPEREYYMRVFDYAMSVLEAGKDYAWRSSDINYGSISADAMFKSKSSYTCRNFREAFNVGGYEGSYSGIACKREGSEGWCRLKEGDALTCALETPAMIANYTLPGINVGMPNVGGGRDGMGTGGSRRGHAPQMPGVAGPAAPSGEAPTGQEYADTVTGTAGKAAGPATKGALEWFNSTFR